MNRTSTSCYKHSLVWFYDWKFYTLYNNEIYISQENCHFEQSSPPSSKSREEAMCIISCHWFIIIVTVKHLLKIQTKLTPFQNWALVLVYSKREQKGSRYLCKQSKKKTFNFWKSNRNIKVLQRYNWLKEYNSKAGL